MKRLKVHVTFEDIDEGMPGEVDYCPIALALHNQHHIPYNPGPTTVGHETAHVNGRVYWLSNRAQKFVRDFDNGQVVNAATFLLTPFEEVIAS